MSGGQANTIMGAIAPGGFGPRILDLADRLAQFSELAGELTCTYRTPAHRDAARQLSAWMETAGLRVSTDVVGNVIGRYPSTNPDAGTLILGSHYDTVRNAGKYDGRLGLLTPLVVIEYLARIGRRLPFHLELIAFSEEEGVRFRTSYIGSRAVAGCFDMNMLEVRDAGGVSLGELIRQDGGNPEDIPSLARDPRNLLGYLEIHIEQGPVLLREQIPVGIVAGIAGSVRYLVTVVGQAGHAGTVPMTGRHDAATAAAEIVLFVERRCGQAPGLVGTVGQLAVPNGVVNVIPGRCELSLDIRADETEKLNAAVDDVLAEIERIGQRRNAKIAVNEIQRTPPVTFSPRLQSQLSDSITRAGILPRYLPSGAGHDALVFAGITDTAMLFVRCGNNGVSHSPDETVSAADADTAARVLLDLLLNWKL